MNICKKIIKITSMINIFKKKKNNKTNIIITIQNDIINEEYINKKTCDKNIIKSTTNILYKILICTILMWPIILMIVYAVIRKEIKYITSNIFQFLPICQYIIGSLYYSSNHYNNCLKRNIDNIKYIIMSYMLSLGISIIIFVTIIVLMTCGSNLSIFKELATHTNLVGFIFVILATAFHSFFSYLIILINLITFGLIFIAHSIEISKYYEKLDKFVDKNPDELSLESITREHAETKSYHGASVDKLNNLFSSITIIGFIGSYYVILYYNTKYTSIYNYMFLATFIIIELLYIYSINKVKSAVSDISKLMSSEKIISRYLSVVNFKDMVTSTGSVNVEDNNDSNDNVLTGQLSHIIEISTRTAIRVNENMRSLAWHTLQKKLSEEWDCFNICGFDIDDATILNKLITIIVGFLMLLNIKNLFGL